VAITQDRAERIAKAHACEHCGEYSYKRLRVVPANGRLKEEMGVVWLATKTCGVCGLQQELGLDEDGDIVFAG
jgi:Fe-S-cluster-containing dehydrogenase component